MTARMFLTRWLSSSFSMRWRTSARPRSSAMISLWRSTISTSAARAASAISRSDSVQGSAWLSHRLLPDREALARGQPVAERSGRRRISPDCPPSRGSGPLPCERRTDSRVGRCDSGMASRPETSAGIGSALRPAAATARGWPRSCPRSPSRRSGHSAGMAVAGGGNTARVPVAVDPQARCRRTT